MRYIIAQDSETSGYIYDTETTTKYTILWGHWNDCLVKVMVNSDSFLDQVALQFWHDLCCIVDYHEADKSKNGPHWKILEDAKVNFANPPELQWTVYRGEQ